MGCVQSPWKTIPWYATEEQAWKDLSQVYRKTKPPKLMLVMGHPESPLPFTTVASWIPSNPCRWCITRSVKQESPRRSSGNSIYLTNYFEGLIFCCGFALPTHACHNLYCVRLAFLQWTIVFGKVWPTLCGLWQHAFSRQCLLLL